MKLDEVALLEIVEILRKGLTELVDVSDLLRNLELEETQEGKLTVKK